MIRNKTDEAFNILKDYKGKNPYILFLKKEVYINKKPNTIGQFQTEYLLKNKDFEPIIINKMTKICDWFAEKKKEDWGTEFLPTKLKIISMIGETSTSYHCYVQYRQSVDPVATFLPKKAVIKNFLYDDYHDYNVDFDRYDKLSTSKDPKRKIKEHQKEAIKFLLSRKKCILADDQGMGKMEPVSANIPTINGFKKMGDIDAGDIVFGSDGKPHNVLKVFPHKDKEIYKVTFNDGTYAECGLDHLWAVRTSSDRIKNKDWRVLSLKEIIDNGIHYTDKYRTERGLKQRNKFQIPTCKPIEYSEKNYLIHPYVLGMCIGDGNLCSGTINISIPDSEKENVERIASLIDEDMMLVEDRYANCPRYRIKHKIRTNRNKYITEIRRLCLDVKGNFKFIPDEYKLGSIEQRIELLRGLMDSDGTIGERNKISFSTVSERLADDIIELINSLGGTAHKHSYDRTKEGKSVEYCVNFQIKINPFHLKRKADKFFITENVNRGCTRYIENVEYVRNEDAKCIMVDSDDHTYITGHNYIVTHNTTSLSVASIEGNFDSVLIICPASLKTNWKNELMWYVSEKDITIIDGFNNKTKGELELFLGYKEGKSKLSREELLEEAKNVGKWQDNHYTIVNFDILDEFYEMPKTRSKENVEKSYQNSPLLQYIANKKSLIIVDEAHRLSNSSSTRSKIIKDLVKRGNPDSLYLATGTPITNNPQNLFCLLQLLDDPIKDDWEYYSQRYCDAMKIPAKGEKAKWQSIFLKNKHKNNWYDLTYQEKDELKEFIKKYARKITISNGASNLDELKERISHIYLRRMKSDIGELPEKHVHTLKYDLNPVQMLEYDRLWEEYEEAKKEESPEKELNRDLLEGAVYRKYLSNQMVENTTKLVDKFIENGEKVVIACCYDEELYSLQEYYGDKCVIYNGKTNSKKKDEAVSLFTSDDNILVFIGNIIACGVGINLVSSHKMVFNNIDYTYANNLQMEDRIYRIGQKYDCDIYYQVFYETQYEKIVDIVVNKREIFNKVIKKEDEK